ncbi:hypothetical protein [Paenarthrobacter sp. YJN-5]|uniref:hypothetical protein n=1 Tax=Paenarthrobacter sp. YJN-5 TaxID=2735316 RepID=UPI0018787B82|nr:hypothetical protein [Paenarthrobacter sp. YJN-5]QOT19387.1 hypothetical protein HMI59_22300 [Paenarthrobacter sp. YJN-5]
MTVIPMNRQPKGVPVGGQFAATAHAEPSVSLTSGTAGRHAASATPNRPVPESLLMAHFQDPKLIPDLEWMIERSADADEMELDHRSEIFSDHVPNLNVEEAYGYFNKARREFVEGGDWRATLAECAAADTTAHPGGTLKGDYQPPIATHQAGYMDGTLTTGSKYTGYRDATEICKDIRADLKAAVAANYLPAALKYSVKNDKYSGGQSITVTVQGVSDEDRLDPTELDHNGDHKKMPEAVELEKRVDAITNAYNRTDRGNNYDYANVAYWGRAEIETDWARDFRESEAAKRKAARDARVNG